MGIGIAAFILRPKAFGGCYPIRVDGRVAKIVSDRALWWIGGMGDVSGLTVQLQWI
jgi:hypothetical protein